MYYITAIKKFINYDSSSITLSDRKHRINYLSVDCIDFILVKCVLWNYSLFQNVLLSAWNLRPTLVLMSLSYDDSLPVIVATLEDWFRRLEEITPYNCGKDEILDTPLYMFSLIQYTNNYNLLYISNVTDRTPRSLLTLCRSGKLSFTTPYNDDFPYHTSHDDCFQQHADYWKLI